MVCFVTGATGLSGKVVEQDKDKRNNLKILSRQSCPEYEALVCDLASELVPKDSVDGVDIAFQIAGFAFDLGDTSKVEYL